MKNISIMSDDDDDVMQRRTSGDDDESVLLPAFINKLLKMLSDPECADTIQYGSDGTTLLVVDSSLFATVPLCLPDLFTISCKRTEAVSRPANPLFRKFYHGSSSTVTSHHLFVN